MAHDEPCIRPAHRHTARRGDLHSFAHKVEVLCPRCGSPGSVRNHDRPGPVLATAGERASFTCGQCAYRTTQWMGPGTLVASRRCPWCGDRVEVTRPHRVGTTPPSALPARCQRCDRDVSLDVELVLRGPAWEPPLDPHLGLELRLKTETRHGWLWAYNRDHLRELRAFVAAAVRSVPGGNTNWASRLPSWITAAKNRDEVLRAIDRLNG